MGDGESGDLDHQAGLLRRSCQRKKSWNKPSRWSASSGALVGACRAGGDGGTGTAVSLSIAFDSRRRAFASRPAMRASESARHAVRDRRLKVRSGISALRELRNAVSCSIVFEVVLVASAATEATHHDTTGFGSCSAVVRNSLALRLSDPDAC